MPKLVNKVEHNVKQIIELFQEQIKDLKANPNHVKNITIFTVERLKYIFSFINSNKLAPLPDKTLTSRSCIDAVLNSENTSLIGAFEVIEILENQTNAFNERPHKVKKITYNTISHLQSILSLFEKLEAIQ